MIDSFNEHFERNREVMRRFRIGDNVVLTYTGRSSGRVLGTVIGYETFGNDGLVELLVKIVTIGRLRETDSTPVWTVNTDNTQVELA